MTKSELKELVKQHFNLTEVNKFSEATLEDGTKVTNDVDGDFAVGQKLFVIDGAGEKVAAPEGEHVTKSGIQLIVDAEGVLTGVKYPDAGGEGSADLAEEIVEEKEDVEMAAEEIVDEEEKMMEGEAPIETVIEIISEVVEEKIDEMKKKVMAIEEEVKDMKDKMSAFAAEPAEEKTLPNRKFSKTQNYKMSKKAETRYNKMLAKLSK